MDTSTIAFAGCWHANAGAGISVLRNLAEKGVTTLVHTGDFLYSYPVAASFIAKIEAECARLGMTIVVVRGNHDNPHIYKNFVVETNERRNAGENFGDDFARISPHILHAPDGLRWNWNGVTFGALGGARSIDWRVREAEVPWWADEVTEMSAVYSMIDAGTLDVLVMHDVPASVPLHFADRHNMPSFWDLESAEAHRVPLQKAVDATFPSFVISGHMHARQEVTVTSDTGLSFKSVILDRGDYKAGTPSRKEIHSNTVLMSLSTGNPVLVEHEDAK